MISKELIDMAKEYEAMMEEGHERVYEGEDPNSPELTELHEKTMKIIHDLETKCENKNIDICEVFKLADN